MIGFTQAEAGGVLWAGGGFDDQYFTPNSPAYASLLGCTTVSVYFLCSVCNDKTWEEAAACPRTFMRWVKYSEEQACNPTGSWSVSNVAYFPRRLLKPALSQLTVSLAWPCPVLAFNYNPHSNSFTNRPAANSSCLGQSLPLHLRGFPSILEPGAPRASCGRTLDVKDRIMRNRCIELTFNKFTDEST